MKTCSVCRAEKPLSEFNKDVSKKDGLRGECRPCNSIRQKKSYAGPPDTSPPGFRLCRKCKASKPVAAFGDQSWLDKGLYTRCQECRAKAYTRKTAPVVRDENGRVCAICRVWKSYAEFYRQKVSSADGYKGSCRQCIKERANLYRQSPAYQTRAAGLDFKRHAAECQKEWVKTHGERRRGYQTAFRQRHPERAWTYQKAKSRAVDLETFRAKVCQRSHRRRARKASAEGSYTAEQWIALCTASCGRCVACGIKAPLTVDHIVPLAKGGTNWIENCQCLCRQCNSRKHTKTIDYRTYPRSAVNVSDPDK